MRARWLFATGTLVAVALLAWWWWPEPVLIVTPSPENATQPTEAVAPVEPSAAATMTASSGLQPAGVGAPFVATGPGGMRLQGRLWRAAYSHAPLVLLIPDDRVRATDWQPLVELMRAVRDYHLVAWDGLALADEGHGGAARLRELVAVEAVLQQVRGMIGGRTGTLGLVGLGSGATAALLWTIERAEVMATVAISPSAALGPQTLAAALDGLAGRQVLVIASADDASAQTAMGQLRALPHVRLVEPAGAAQGLELLNASDHVRPEVNGWLFAALGPVRD